MIDGNNLHRVVIYKDGADTVSQLPPFSGQDSLDPRELWKALARYEAQTGGEVIAVPHNGNLSNGMMFPSETVDGEPIGPEVREPSCPLGADLRSHPGQGRRRGPPNPVAQR